MKMQKSLLLMALKRKEIFLARRSSFAGHNYRLPNHLAALGASQLKKLKKFKL